jgi:uncharacterized cupin superfamily protein
MNEPNVFDPDFDDVEEREGFSRRDAQIGRQAGSERLGASVYEIAPGNATFPYHYHFGNEEMLIVLSGQPHLRTSDGWRQLSEGEVVAFPVGERGAHQVANRTESPARILVISEMEGPDVVVYPDSGKVGARERAPGTGAGLRKTFRAGDEVDYWEGESPPEAPS